MPAVYAAPLQDLIDELGRLPGIGPKSAQRIAFHLLKVSEREAGRLVHAINELKARITLCPRCFNIAEGAECGICADPRRDPSVLCVVEEARDLVAGVPCGALMGVIIQVGNNGQPGKPGRPFAIGEKREVTPKETGLLFLRVNAPAGNKNSGKLKVLISGYVKTP